jgi:hypothetical protein
MNTVSTSAAPKFFEKIDSIIGDAIKHLRTMGYKHGTIRNYRYVWKEFYQFVMKNSEQITFSTNLVSEFLNSCGIFPDKVQTDLTFRQRHIRNVMHVLTEFALHGCCQRRSHVAGRTELCFYRILKFYVENSKLNDFNKLSFLL